MAHACVSSARFASVRHFFVICLRHLWQNEDWKKIMSVIQETLPSFGILGFAIKELPWTPQYDIVLSCSEGSQGVPQLGPYMMPGDGDRCCFSLVLSYDRATNSYICYANYALYTRRNLFEILLYQIEIRLHLSFSDWFGTKLTSV